MKHSMRFCLQVDVSKPILVDPATYRWGLGIVWLALLVTHSTAICDSLAAIPPYSAL